MSKELNDIKLANIVVKVIAKDGTNNTCIASSEDPELILYIITKALMSPEGFIQWCKDCMKREDDKKEVSEDEKQKKAEKT